MSTNLLKLSFALFLFNCLNCSSQITTSSKQDFEFHNGKESIVLEISTGNQYLELDNETRVKIKLENIDPKTLSFSGQGIRFSPVQDSSQAILLEIKPTTESLEDGKLSLMLSYPSGDENIIHRFIIPVR